MGGVGCRGEWDAGDKEWGGQKKAWGTTGEGCGAGRGMKGQEARVHVTKGRQQWGRHGQRHRHRGKKGQGSPTAMRVMNLRCLSNN